MADLLRETARLLKHLGGRIDAMSLDLARDVGAVTRDAQAFAHLAQERASMVARATPRTVRIVQAAAAVLARQRWLRIAAAARGEDKLRPDDHRDLARRVSAYAGELRGGIAKLGQLASCRPDLIGPIWAGELAKLQDEVPPVEVAAIREVIERELGKPLGELFAEFEDAPIAAASLAQVHGAVLHDGTRVVVKVQVPGIDDVIVADIAALRAIAGMLGDIPGVDLQTIATELSRALATELDYVAEADALARFATETTAIVARPLRELSTARVLTMTRIDGERLVTRLDRLAPADRDRVLAELVGEVAAQVLVRGHVHADPHPGNFLVTADDHLAVLDFGCVLELSPADRAAYARLVLAIAGGNHAAAARELAQLGFSADDPDQLVDLAAAIVGALRPGADASKLDWQAAFADQVAHAKQIGGLVIPPSFVLLGRVLAAIAGLLATYRPRIELHALIGRYLAAAVTAS